jgi:hypothetical protein
MLEQTARVELQRASAQPKAGTVAREYMNNVDMMPESC